VRSTSRLSSFLPRKCSSVLLTDRGIVDVLSGLDLAREVLVRLVNR
jgi:hypothetical protein